MVAGSYERKNRRALGIMKHAIDIFSYGITQLFTNFGAALRLTGLVWLAASLVIYGFGYFMVGQPVGLTGLRPDAEGQMPDLSATFSMVALTINLFAVSWVTLIWSRFCLGADVPSGIFPSLKGASFGGHLLTVVLVTASVGAFGFILSLIGSFALPVMPLLVGLFAYPMLVGVLLIWFLFRLGAAIPGAAAGQVMSLTQAWSGSGGNGLWFASVLAFITAALLFLPSIFLSGLLIPGAIGGMVASWFLLLMGTGWLVAILRLCPTVQND